jgi:putative hydrolase of the HAD superfamily
MRFTTIFFDLDDTLYPSDNGLWLAIKNRMRQYMHERVGIPSDEVPVLQKQYFETYGTTLRGLIYHYQVDPHDYLVYVHDLHMQDYLRPAPELRSLLLSLPQKRWIFTNADIDHARRVISGLGLEGCFDGVVDLKAMDFLCKPEPAAFQRALQIAGNPDPKQCILMDDVPTNLVTARRLGFATVLVSLDGAMVSSADHIIKNLLSLPQAMPELWEGLPGSGANHGK